MQKRNATTQCKSALQKRNTKAQCKKRSAGNVGSGIAQNTGPLLLSAQLQEHFCKIEFLNCDIVLVTLFIAQKLLTLRLLLTVATHAKLIRRLASLYVHPFMHRKELMCTLGGGVLVDKGSRG